MKNECSAIEDQKDYNPTKAKDPCEAKKKVKTRKENIDEGLFRRN